MSRYIDAEILLDAMRHITIGETDVARSEMKIVHYICHMPHIDDVRENVRGYLVNIEPSLTLIDAIPTPSGEKALLSMDKSCSKCKTPIPPNICNNVWFKYCPFCGADLSVERADT